ncbi:MAG TPA: hypothetical protein PKA58_15815 [Polyangium sp.]|nr:hypothetical protein [Polyangium sp.]
MTRTFDGTARPPSRSATSARMASLSWMKTPTCERTREALTEEPAGETDAVCRG